MLLNKSRLTFCYFGIYEPRWARDTVLLRGLQLLGAEIIFCVDGSPGFSKYCRLISHYFRLRRSYDYLLVGYLSNIVVPLARLLSRRKVIFNAGNSMYEGSVLDRGHRSWLKKERYVWLIDFLAFHSAHLILIETQAQKEFIAKTFFVPRGKIEVSWTGVDDRIFYPDKQIRKRDSFWVLFRGWFVPATGIEYVLQAAALLKDKGVRFLIIGRGSLRESVEEKIIAEHLTNVELLTDFVTDSILHKMMLSCHIMLGQFSGHARLERTIQNKTYEALALGLPYITQTSLSNAELLTDGVHCLFTKPADVSDLAEKILLLKSDPARRDRLGAAGRALYERLLTPQAIAARFLQFLPERC